MFMSAISLPWMAMNHIYCAVLLAFMYGGLMNINSNLQAG